MGSKNGYFREFGRFRLDPEKKVLYADDRLVDQQLKEIELLCLLTERRGELLTKNEILDQIWAGAYVEESNLSQHIYRLRKTFKQFGETGEIIQTVPRRGYRFVGEVAESGNDELVIERHSISKTVVEAFDVSEEPNATQVGTIATRAKQRRVLIPATVFALIAATLGFGAFLYNRSAVAAADSIKSVAVLPLRTLSGEENGSAGLGFADALITSLGKLDGIEVRSANASSRFADGENEPVAFGKKLGVDAVIDGAMQRENGKLRVTLRLIRTSDGRQIWADSFDRPESEVFALQDTMAAATAGALSLKLKQNNLAKRPTDDIEAYQAYVRGLYLFRRRETSKAGVLYQRAVDLDPNFAKAWAGLAAMQAMGDAMPKAEATINRALELDPNLAEAHAVRGFIKMFLDWDWSEAEKSLAKSVELDPNSVEAHHWLGTLFSIRRRFDEAEISLKRALELDPASANLIADLGLVYFYSGRYDRAEATFLQARKIDEAFANSRLRDVYQLTGREAEASHFAILVRCGTDKPCLQNLTRAYEREGIVAITRAELRTNLAIVHDKNTAPEWISQTWYGIALGYAKLGQRDDALDALERSLTTKLPFEMMTFTFPFLRVEPGFEIVRNDPRFANIATRVKLD